MSEKNIDTSQIENNAVLEIEYQLKNSLYLETHIWKGDKYPSWDGDIIIYESKGKKSNILGRVPVQVKGTQNGDIDKSEISFSVDMVDLKNYRNDGGVVFFVVLEKDTCNKIYYALFYPLFLSYIINNYEKQKTRALKFVEFPSDDKERTNILYYFDRNRKLQMSSLNCNLPSLNDVINSNALKKIHIPLYSIPNTSPAYTFLNQNLYAYAEFNNIPIWQPIKGNIECKHILTTINEKIIVGGKIFYDSYKKEIQKDKVIFYLGNSIKFECKKNNPKVNFVYNTSQSVRTIVNDLGFLLEIIDKKKFLLGNIPLDFPVEEISTTDFDLEKSKLLLQKCQKIVTLLDTLHCNKDLDFYKLSPKELNDLLVLWLCIVEGKSIESKKEKTSILRFNIQDIFFIFFIIQEQNNMFKIYDFFEFDSPLMFEPRNEKQDYVSHFTMLCTEDFLTLDNIQYNKIVPSLSKYMNNPFMYVLTHDLMMHLLEAYEKTERKNAVLNGTAKDIKDLISKSYRDKPEIRKEVSRLYMENNIMQLPQGAN